MQAGAELSRRAASLVESIDEPIQVCGLAEPGGVQCSDHIAETWWNLRRIRVAVGRIDELVGDQHVEDLRTRPGRTRRRG
jgi:hypothetical protein